MPDLAGIWGVMCNNTLVLPALWPVWGCAAPSVGVVSSKRGQGGQYKCLGGGTWGLRPLLPIHTSVTRG